MAFLALASQKSLLQLQKNFLQLQLTSVQNRENEAAATMTMMEEQNQGVDLDNDRRYQYYAALDEQLLTEQDSIETQLTAIDNELSGLKTLVNNGIKASCQLNIT